MRALQCLALAPLLAAAFVLALVAAETAPDAAIAKNILADEELFEHPRAQSFTGRGKIDVFTECLGVSVGLPDGDAKEGPFKRAMRAPVFTSCEALIAFARTGEAPPGAAQEYHRYWHGYAALSRPLLAAIPYRDLRMLTFNTMALLFAALGWALAREFGLKVAAAFLLPFYFINFAGFMILWTKASAWFVPLGGAIYMARARAPYVRDPYIAFFLFGALTAFLDLLTTPLLAFGLPALVYFMVLLRRADTLAPRAEIVRLALIGGFWLAGYAGLWAIKIALAAYVAGPDAVSEALRAAATRINGEWESVKHFPGAAILENFEVFKAFWGAAAAVMFFILPFATAARRRAALSLVVTRPAFALIALAPFAWFEILSNHSQIHGLFTHALLVLTFIPLSLVLFGVTGRLAAPKPL